MLRAAFKKGQFSKVASQIVCKQLKEKGEFEVARKLEDLAPLFDPHDFWDSQPVPKLHELIKDEEADMPIETKTLD